MSITKDLSFGVLMINFLGKLNKMINSQDLVMWIYICDSETIFNNFLILPTGYNALCNTRTVSNVCGSNTSSKGQHSCVGCPE